MLAFYLPQSHPSSETDTWPSHGSSDWRQVRAANPLFVGHYQQHVPHPDLGYYRGDSPEILRVQWGMLTKSGVYGLIFCHYWPADKFQFESPAQMLMRDRSIDLPFCFCWDNKDWAQRRYGNEQERLLEQDEYEEDAAAVIRYLIPFFEDERYIRIDDRPVLFINRPPSIECIDRYRGIWADHCRLAGLPDALFGRYSSRRYGPPRRPCNGCCLRMRSSRIHGWKCRGAERYLRSLSADPRERHGLW